MDEKKMKCMDQNSQVVSVRFPRIMIAAEKSGGGKTLFTCALLSLLKEKVQAVRAFKCGPDYIDPMFHRTVLEIPSRNLDSFFADADILRYLLGREILEVEDFPESRIAVLEGVMGFYDGLGGVSEQSSAWEVADLTDTPVILLVDMKGRSLSALASIRGFLDYKEKSHVAGVIFNRLSPMLYPGLKERAERELGVRVFGYAPELKDLTLESRHLGLVMPEEISGIRERLDLIKEKVRKVIDLDGIIEEAGRAAEIEMKLPETARGSVILSRESQDHGSEPSSDAVKQIGNVKKPIVAVARDEAFCFYYEDNLDLLRKLGAEIQYFSPIRDEKLPEGTCAVYLGGGYPELHAKALSENISMRNAIHQVVAEEMPCIAECGGYLYLKDSIVDPDGVEWPMAGGLPGSSRDTGKLGRFGYITVTSKKDGLLGPAGTEFRAHEFHHWDSEENGTDFSAKKPVGTRGWDCGYTTENFYAGFPHLYFYSNVKIAENFIKRAELWKKMNSEMKCDSRMKINLTEETSIEETWKAYLNKIELADRTAMELAKKRWNSVAKPIGSLGILEEDIIKIAGIRGNSAGITLDRSALAVMCADHGVVAEGVSQTSKDVTKIVAENFTKGETSTSKMCRVSGTNLYPVDMGMDCEPTGQEEPDMHRILDRKVAKGSGNIAREPAMSRTECLQALLSGMDLAFRFKEMGYELLAAGEMGIGNTTPAAAMSAVLAGLSTEQATGRGAGLSDAGLEKKKHAVEMAVSRFYAKYPEYRNGTKEQYESGELSAMTVLAELGGFDLAGMTGLFLGGAAAKVPVLMDGFLSTVSGLLAVLIKKETRDYIFASHISTEPAGAAVLQMLDLPAPLHMGMHLGEGSGAVTMIPLLKMGAKVYEEMSTFSDISVEQYVDYAEKGDQS